MPWQEYTFSDSHNSLAHSYYTTYHFLPLIQIIYVAVLSLFLDFELLEGKVHTHLICFPHLTWRVIRMWSSSVVVG